MRIHLYNIHGLLRAGELEIGKDADNGGQLIYLMEMAKALSQRPEVSHVHIFTRRIEDPSLAVDYSREVEPVTDKLDIRRINCGGKRYLAKEKLWPCLDEFVTNSIQHIKKHKILPDWIHSHYADAGYVAAELSQFLNVPFAHTGHSLGIPKMMGLLKTGMTREELEKRYEFSSRFAAENRTLSHAEFVITSTEQEISTYEPYENFNSAVFNPIPPGIDTQKFYPYFEDELSNGENRFDERQALHDLRSSLKLFFTDPDRPIIMALSRPDRKKNIQGLIHAYGTSRELQQMANLAIFAGVRKDINSMPIGEKETLTEILLLMDKYDLYGKIAIPKKTGSPMEIPALYRHCASRHGVFVNIALQENFGLTTLEAASSGLPTVVTNAGGPSEVVERCQCGVALDPTDTQAIQKALKELLLDQDYWQKCSKNGMKLVRDIYTWPAHVERYMQIVQENLEASRGTGKRKSTQPKLISRRLKKAKKMIICDIDGTIVSPSQDNPGLEAFKAFLKNRPDNTLFGLATGRNRRLVQEVIKQFDLPRPDFTIASVGTEIVYDLEEHAIDQGWHKFIQYQWHPERIRNLLLNIEGLELQDADAQSQVKISYVSDLIQEALHDEVHSVLGKDFYKINFTFSHGHYLDILPRRASKGRAVRYLASKLNVPLNQVVTFGDSGNDYDMLNGPMKSVVVSNHSEELEPLRGRKNTYFSDKPAASGILDGLNFFGVKND